MDFVLKDSFARRARYHLWNVLITLIQNEVGGYVFLAIRRFLMVRRDAKLIETVVTIKFKYTVLMELDGFL
jgi:formate/nitrite transporter FocA (FNT family)